MAIDLCASAGRNVARVNCDPKKGTPEMFLLGTKVFTEEEYCGDLYAAIMAAVNLPDGTPGKLYVIQGVDNVTDNTPENTTGTTGRGSMVFLNESKAAYTFGMLKGSNEETRMRAFNRQDVPVFVIDDLGQMWGYKTANGGFAGYDAMHFTDPKPFSNGADVDSEYTNYNVYLRSAVQFGDSQAVVKLTFPYTDIEGLRDAVLEYVSNVGEVHQFDVKFKNTQLCADIDLVEEYGGVLADEDLFTGATYGASATPIAISGVSIVAGKVQITYDSVTYAAIPEGTRITQPVIAPAALAEKGITGTEIQGTSWLKEAATT